MNKGVITAIIVAIFVAVGAFAFLGNDSDDDNSNVSTNSPASPSSETSSNPVSSPSGAGSYVEYSDTVLADTAGTEQVLFFHAEWCPTCKFYESEIEKSGVPEGITVIKIDYDDEDELKEQYGVTVQSTFVWLDANGEVMQSWPFASGLKSPQDLFDVVQEG